MKATTAIVKATDEDERNPSAPNDEEILLDLLFAHRMGWVQDFLKARKLSWSGDKRKLRDRVIRHLVQGTITRDELIELLDEVEGWGNQHIYLYRVSQATIAELSSEDRVKQILQRQRCAELFNRRIALLLPPRLTLSAVQWSDGHLRFVWIETRRWRERLPEHDKHQNGIEFDAYKSRVSRGIIAFDFDLVTGTAELLIQRLPSGNKYAEQRQRLEGELARFIDIKGLSEFRISGGIRRIDEANEARKRSTELETVQGSRIVLTSRAPEADAYGDPTMQRARSAIGSDGTGRLGNFYWPIEDSPGREVHVKLYAKDQRVGIFGECTRAEVKYVLSRVRSYCRTTSRS